MNERSHTDYGVMFMPEPFSKGDQSRAEILDAARRLFITQGYNGTSMRAIAHEAGNRAVAGIYNHFPTKEAIFKALIEERNPYGDLFNILDSSQGGTAPEYIRNGMRTILHVMPRHYDFFQLVQIDIREFEGRYLNSLLETMVIPRVFGMINDLRSLEGLKPIPPLVLMRMMGSIAIGYIVTSQIAVFSPFDETSSDAAIEQIIDLLLYGIAD
jgi:AcrR family transcriptional regulator